MIEVEIKFEPTEEQFNLLTKDAIFVGEVINHDIYYDYSDYRLFKNHIRLRNRNNSFELKIIKKTGISIEVEDEEEIKKYFKTDLKLIDFVNKNLIAFVDYQAKRRQYKKGEFNIDKDEMSYGYDLCEIEIMIEKEEDEKEAEEKILNLAKEFNIERKKMPPKILEYLRLVKPEIYNEIKGMDKK